jgi:hypothetical protein
MANNLLVTSPMTTFPQNNSAFADALSYLAAGNNLMLANHLLMGIIASLAL